jgi:Holliday junction resolvase
VKYPEKITHAELVELGRNWLIRPFYTTAPYGHYGCSVVLTELSAATYGAEIPDVLGFCPNKSVLIECKASLADFRADQKKPFRIVGENALGLLRWYLAPRGLIPIEEIPGKWGLLEVLQGRSIIATKKAEPQSRGYESEMACLLSLLRRLNISTDDHVAIKRYSIKSRINRATFFVDSKYSEDR